MHRRRLFALLRRQRFHTFFTVGIIVAIVWTTHNLISSNIKTVRKQAKSQKKRQSIEYYLDFNPYNNRIPLKPGTTGYVYSKARGDRSGAFVHDMLMAHAMAFKRNLTYGGACVEDLENENLLRLIRRHEHLIEAVGLENELLIACPLNTSTDITMHRRDYDKPSEQLWTPKWRASMEPILRKQKKPTAKTKVVVHIRRGDVTPCKQKTDFRYLPNSHYRRLLDMHVNDTTAQITIFSQKSSFEPWSDFDRPNIHLQLDTDLEIVWREIQTADIFIMSRSSFSFVPAVLNMGGQVIYTPFWHTPLQHWTVLDKAVVNESEAEVEQLKSKCEKLTIK